MHIWGIWVQHFLLYFNGHLWNITQKVELYNFVFVCHSWYLQILSIRARQPQTRQNYQICFQMKRLSLYNIPHMCWCGNVSTGIHIYIHRFDTQLLYYDLNCFLCVLNRRVREAEGKMIKLFHTILKNFVQIWLMFFVLCLYMFLHVCFCFRYICGNKAKRAID